MRYLCKNLLDLEPYRAKDLTCNIMLNNNESPFDLPYSTKKRLISKINNGNIFNHYPDPNANLLRQAIADYCNVGPDNILVAPGSDELIRMIVNTFVDKGEYTLCPTPSFDMYSIYTKMMGGKPISVKLSRDFSYDIDTFLSRGSKYKAKIAFICNPNNPTGTVTAIKSIENLAKNFDGVVVIDEAYYEFYGKTMIDLIYQYDNVILLRTFSKAFGLAGLRIGYLIASKNLVDDVYLTKSPYNMSSFSQLVALELLKDLDIIKKRVNYIVKQRERLYKQLKNLKEVQVVPSKANFLLIKLNNNAKNVYKRLLQKGILVRNFPNHHPLANCLRVSIGAKEDNDVFLMTLISILDDGS